MTRAMASIIRIPLDTEDDELLLRDNATCV